MVLSVKIVVFGSGAVGKSALTVQWIQGRFIEMYDPTIEDTYMKALTVDDEQCMVEIVDTAGQDNFGAMREVYMRTGSAFMLVFSITKLDTFRELSQYTNQILRVRQIESLADVHLMLVGNKVDLQSQREVSRVDAEKLADEWGCSYIEASAKTRQNVETAFLELARKVVAVEKTQQPKTTGKKFCRLI